MAEFGLIVRSMFLALVVPLCVLLVAGCVQENNANVSGVVTLDGKPLDHGDVTFVTKLAKKSAGTSGAIQSDGSYSIQLGQSGAVIVGEYSVAVVSREPSIPREDGGPPDHGALLTPEQYSMTENSGLRYSVRAGKNVIDIALSSDHSTGPALTPEGSGSADAPEDDSDEDSVPQTEEAPAL